MNAGTVMKMVQNSLYGGSLIAILGLGGCVTDEPTVTPISGPETQLCRATQIGPKWIASKKPFSGDRKAFYGVGNQSNIQNAGLARRTAEAQARRAIANSFKFYTAALLKQYVGSISSTTTSEDVRTEEQVAKDVMKEVTDGTLTGVSIEEYWESPCKEESYALARLDLERFLDNLSSYTANDKVMKQMSEKLRQSVEKNSAKAFEALARELEKAGG